MTSPIACTTRYVADIVIILVSVFVFGWPKAGLLMTQYSRGDVVIHDENRPPAHLFFAAAGRTSELKALFSAELVQQLRQINGGIALSTDDFSSDRVQLVRELNAAGVPIVVSIALDADQGYYVNADNEPATADRFSEFDKWSTANGLRWEAVGLDIEPSLTEWSVINGHKLRFAGMILRRLFESNRQINRTRDLYAALIRRMQSRGYCVQTYQLPLIVNERKARSTVLEKTLGLVDVRGDQEVLMLYTSFNPLLGAAIIWQYGPDAQAIAIGSTAGNPDPSGRFSPLNWEEFSRDLIVAHHFSSTIGVYSLEGCSTHGYLSRLETMDWSRPVFISGASIRKAARIQKFVYCLLWIGRFWMYFAAIFLLLIAGLARMLTGQLKSRRLRKQTISPADPSNLATEQRGTK